MFLAKKQLNLSQGEFKNKKLNNQSVFSLVSPGAYVIKKSPVGILWSKQATSLDILIGP